jgi:hypothetical protein
VSSAEAREGALAAYADAGIDTLILFAEIPGLEQVEQLAEHVLPAYR